jgi:membrane associated rhomboid family serine protease
MGFQDRDYTRENSYSDAAGGWGFYISPVVKGLIAANVAVFVLQIFAVRPMTVDDVRAQWKAMSERTRHAYRNRSTPDSGVKKTKSDAESKSKDKEASDTDSEPPAGWADIELEDAPKISVIHEWLELKPSLVLRGQIWRLLTYSFCHDRYGVFHILFNMIALYYFGITLESMYGGREFLLFYLAAAVFSGVINVLLDVYLGSDIPAVGASGSVMGVLMLYAIHFPRSLIRIFFISIEARWLVCLYVIIDLYPVLLAMSGDPMLMGGIAHAAHLGGLLFGFLYWRFGLHLERWWETLARSKRQVSRQARRFWGTYPKIARQSEQQKEDDVDAILKKLHESGVDSLSANERRILEQESERLRKRRS